MLVDWIANVGVLSLGAFAFFFLGRRGLFDQKTLKINILLGAFLGVLTSIVVLVPVSMPTGSTFDTRAGPALIAGFYLGFPGALITAAIASGARLWMGGPFAFGGAAGPIVYILVGMALARWFPPKAHIPGPIYLTGLALVGTLAVLPCFFIDQGVSVGLRVLEQAWLLLVLGNLAGVLILGLMISEAQRFAVDNRRIRSTLKISDLARSSAGIAIWRFDLKADRLTWDDAMFDLFDVAKADFQGKFEDWENTLHPDDRSAARKAFLTAYENGSEFATDFRIVLKDKSLRWIKAHCQFLRDEDGGIAEAVGVNWDISPEKHLQAILKVKEREARAKSDELEVTLASVIQGVSAFNEDGKLRFSNDRVQDILGLPESLMVPGTPYERYCQYREGAGFSAFHEDGQILLDAGKDVPVHFRSLIHLTNGRVLSFSSVPMPDGGWVETYEDVTEKALADQRVKRAAETDSLTGLANRLCFNTALEQVVEKASRDHVADHALLLIDLNDFKSVNDNYGHVVGDRLLKKVGEILRKAARPEDLAARLGGDEFALLLAKSTDADLKAVAERICADFDIPLDLGRKSIRTGVSIGAARILPGYEEVEEVLSRADIALYKAKDERGSFFRLYDAEIASEEAERRRVKSDLIQVVQSRGLEVYGQPILNLATRQVDHFEALVRWQNGSTQFIPPSNFIPLAEEIGLISEVGDFVLHEVLEHLSCWPDTLKACINVSVLQLGDGRFAENVLNSLSRQNVSPLRLEVEVTESILMEHGSGAHADLQRLRTAGITLALDDFGIGFSSLGYLQEMRFDKLKIDRKFVSEVDTSSGSAAIVRSISDLAKSLQMTCTAEGVENAGHLYCIEQCGCDYAQGFHIGEPVPLSQIEPGFVFAGGLEHVPIEVQGREPF
ncbi:EAL domain-containing protein [Roseibium denhamense]|uniref:Diguanylate cyclase (GGDEF) domain-containing protein n=1 Tax=Roseibium denhamense TaxID=76305 RepID=A0ABY1NDX3_9HYPH|nr:EAL domain-containing protein [Roseibium denhamense]MTI04163.1 EAL domain-containing protein [Roseibium denhamense]SMP07352.1 diguanylate cyclase (GGDEF) domain-containing protein [Roseibium denhamense]